MSNLEALTRDYIALLEDGQEEGSFLRSHPWILDAEAQDPNSILRALRGEAARFAELQGRPRFSLIAALGDTNPGHLNELILSCRCQSYPDWELILVDDASREQEHLTLAREWTRRDPRIRLLAQEIPRGACHAANVGVDSATGDYLAMVDGDGVVHPLALGLLARYLHEDPKLNLVYTNELEIGPEWTWPTRYLLKPPFDLFTLLRQPYLGRLTAIRSDLVREVSPDGPVFRSEFEGFEEHDLWLRLARSGRLTAQHVPLYAYYRRPCPVGRGRQPSEMLAEKRSRLLDRHAPGFYPGVTWTSKVTGEQDALAPTSVWITGLPDLPRPRLLIVVPFKDQVEVTIQCLESIERQVHSLDVLVALVNNNSSKPETRTRLAEWLAQPRAVRHTILEDHGAFNYARLNNTAVRQFGDDRDLILFMNNDVELVTPQALQVMAMQLLADGEAGFVGIKLHYPAGQGIQHGGVRFVQHTHGSGYHLLAHAHAPEELVDSDRVSMCVTFACAMTRRATFDSLGGLEELFFPNGFGDADICLRALAAGYRNYYLGSVEGLHHESISRGSANEEIEFTTLHQRHGRAIGEWRLRYLYQAARHPWPAAMPPASVPEAAAAAGGFADARLPLRYRSADAAVNLLKRILGPAYGGLRTRAIRTAKGVRRLRTRGALYAALRTLIKPIPFVGPAGAKLVRMSRRAASWTRACGVVAGYLRHDPGAFRRLVGEFRSGGAEAALRDLSTHLPTLELQPYLARMRFRRSRPTRGQLASLRSRTWPEDAPKFSILMPVYNPKEIWLRQAVESVQNQTYPNWELVCVDDASPAPHVARTLQDVAAKDPRVVVIRRERNHGVSAATNRALEAATGDYACFMDHDDALEPHALHRFAEAILRDRPDMLYSDEAITADRIDKILRVDLRPDFSYDHYLGHPYFVHLIAARTDIVRQIGGLDTGMSISQDVDLNLRLIEACETICHVPEVLYRWRTHPTSLGHRKMDECTSASHSAIERHFRRTGQRAAIHDGPNFNHRDIRFQADRGGRIAILVLSSGDSGRTAACLESLERTVDRRQADIILVDEEGAGVAERLDRAVERLEGEYGSLLFLDDSVRAGDPGWLEHMQAYADRLDVGVVGAILLDDRRRIRQAGLVLGPDGQLSNRHEGSPFLHWISGRNPGRIGELLASHDVSAVPCACLLTRSDVFEELRGFDGRFSTSHHDADYCLRAAGAGYKVLLDSYAQLIRTSHPEEAAGDRRPTSDEALFLDIHRARLEGGDPYEPTANTATGRSPRTVRITLPSSPKGRPGPRIAVHGPGEIGHGPHGGVAREAGSRRSKS